MVREAIYHRMDSNYAFLLDIETLVIRLRAKKNDLKQCILFYGDRCDIEPPQILSIDMPKRASDTLFDYFEIQFKPEWKRIFYYFLLDDGNEQLYYYNDAFYPEANKFRTRYYQYAYIREKDIVSTPDWIKDSIMYQIFPDSFATSKTYLSCKKNQYITEDGHLSLSHLGGTLKGIKENLDYLKDLGVNCIYMTPIFKADSYHKYDIVDYYEIDPLLGTKEDFRELVDACHSQDMRIILDGVFNHTSTNFFAFKDILKKGDKSDYIDWYIVHSYPVKIEYPPNYEAFAYVEGMPRTNTANEEVIEYFVNVGLYWINEFRIDGWRLDVANEVDHEFWRIFRKAIKKAKNDAFIVGEIWEDAHSFLEGDQFDSVMNYPFMYSCEEFFAYRNLSVTQFDEKMASLRMRYKIPIQQCMMNMLDSHDVRRFMHCCRGDLRKLKMAAAFQLTYVGVPSVFYGDELGFSGLKENEYRRQMEWEIDKQQTEIYKTYKKLIHLRSELLPLRRGEFNTEFIDDGNGIYAYSRSCDSHKVLVIINNSQKGSTCKIPLDFLNKIENVYGESRYMKEEEHLVCYLQGYDVMIFSIQ